MTTRLEDVGGIEVGSVQAQPAAPNGLTLSGTMTMRDPVSEVQPYLQRLHQAALADGVDEFVVDVTALTFVNSSALRLFIDWAMWVKDTPEANRYLLVFRTNTAITWQRTSFSALKSLGGGSVEIR